MRVYVKRDNNFIDDLEINKVISELSSKVVNDKIPPFIIAFFGESKTNFLLCFIKDTLCRFPLRKAFDDSIGSDIYYPMPCFFEYDYASIITDDNRIVKADDKIFQSVPKHGRFTSDRNFYISENALVTVEEFESFKKINPEENLSKEINKALPSCDAEKVKVPYLADSFLSNAQQERLYFGSIIKSCDTFYNSLSIILTHFDSPEKILSAVLVSDVALLQAANNQTISKDKKLTSDEKKYIERYFLPFFEPEVINQIAIYSKDVDKNSGFGGVNIGEIIRFYVHCVRDEINKLKLNSDFHNDVQRIYQQDVLNAMLGTLPSNFKSQHCYWSTTEKTIDETLVSPNAEIIQALSLIFGVNHVGSILGEQISYVKSVLINYSLAELHHIITALKEYKKTLEDKSGKLHFSVEYSPAINHLCALYPVPHENDEVDFRYRNSFLFIVNMTLVEAVKILQIKEIDLYLRNEDFEKLGVDKIVKIIKGYSNNQLEVFLETNCAKHLVRHFFYAEKLSPLFENLSHPNIKRFFVSSCYHIDDARFQQFLRRLPKAMINKVCAILPAKMFLKGMCLLSDFMFVMSHTEYHRQPIIIEAVLHSRALRSIITDIADFRMMYGYCTRHGSSNAASIFTNKMKVNLPNIICTMKDYVCLLKSELNETEKSDCVSAFRYSICRVVNNLLDFSNFLCNGIISTHLKEKTCYVLLESYNNAQISQLNIINFFVSQPDREVIFLAGMYCLLRKFASKGGGALSIAMLNMIQSEYGDSVESPKLVAARLKSNIATTAPIKRAIDHFVQKWEMSNIDINIGEIYKHASQAVNNSNFYVSRSANYFNPGRF